MNWPPPQDESPSRSRYRPILWAALALGTGVVVDATIGEWVEASLFPCWWLGGVLALAAGSARRSDWRRVSASHWLLLAAMCLGGAWHHWRWNYEAHDDLARFAREEPQPTCVRAVLADRVRISPPADRSPLRAMPARTMSEATVRIVAIRDGAQWRPAAGSSRLRVAGPWRGAVRGDRLQIFAQLGKPAPPMNPGQYDWAAAERRAGRLSELYCDEAQCIEVTRSGAFAGPSAWLRGARSWCESRLSQCVEPTAAPLVLATLLGDQERLSDSTKDAFLETGSIHLLVVSGMHVALLAGLAWSVARAAGLSGRRQAWAAAVAVTIYAAIVGPQPSVIRASVLALATIWALSRGRIASAGNLLGAAALAVILYNPCEVFRAGTQLSFLSVAVLIGFARWMRRSAPVDPLKKLIADSRPWPVRQARRTGRAVGTLTLASLVVGAAIAPLVAYHFHIVTPASIVLTPLAGPLIAVALYAGAAIVSVGWLVPPLQTALGAICGGALELTQYLVVAARHAPASYAYCSGFNAWWLAIGYGAAAGLAMAPRWRPSPSRQVALAATWFTLGYGSLAVPATSRDELNCTFLSMGHGTCVVMELPGGETILYDAGSLGSPETACQTIASFLWSRGISRIDAIVLSHADIDHYNAVPGLIERFAVGVVYVSPMMFDPIATDGRLTAPNYLGETLRQCGVPLQEIWTNDRLRTTDARVTIDVLHPPQEGVPGRDNANSLLLLVEFLGRRILLPGDLESPGIELVMNDPATDCDILLAPHHGSENSDPPGFAAWCTPEWVVMSGRRPARTMPADRSYKASGAKVAHTAAVGAITFTLAEGDLAVSYHRESGADETDQAATVQGAGAARLANTGRN